MTAHPVLVTLVAYFLFVAAIDAMPKPSTEQDRGWYGWLYRFANILAANASRLARARFGDLAGAPSSSPGPNANQTNTVAAGEREDQP